MELVIRAYYNLIKPGIILGNLITASAGFFYAERLGISWSLYGKFILALWFILAAGCALNNYLDREFDAKMIRTKERALVQKLISPLHALIFSLVLCIIGICLFILWDLLLPLGVALAGLVIYVLLYTLLKPRSSYATFVGSLAGALPPVIGYTAVFPHIDEPAFWLFAMMVLWQMPHFFSITLFRHKEYELAEIPIWPVVRGVAATQKQILFYLVLYLVSLWLFTLRGYASKAFIITMTLLTFYWLVLGVRGMRGSKTALWARGMFRFSLLVVLVWSCLLALHR